jgi:hypothetical protein
MHITLPLAKSVAPTVEVTNRERVKVALTPLSALGTAIWADDLHGDVFDKLLETSRWQKTFRRKIHVGISSMINQLGTDKKAQLSCMSFQV